MVPDGRTDGMDGWKDDGHTDDAKTISLRLRRGITNLSALYDFENVKFQDTE